MRATSDAVAACIAAAAILAGCTLTRTDVVDCDTDGDCRAAFGLGFVCNRDGLCDEVEPAPRCSETFPPGLFDDRFQERDRILFGNLMDRSVQTQVARERSAQLAYDQANQEDGVDGRSFGAVFCTVEENPDYDDLARTDAAVASAEFLATSLGVPAIVGPAASSDTQAVFQALAGTGVLVISPSATSPSLTDLDPATVSDDAPGLLWRTAPSDGLQGAVIAADMLDPGEGRAAPVAHVAVIHEVGAYGEGLFDVFAPAFQDGGGTVDLLRPFDGDGQLADAIADVASSRAEEVLFISSQPDDIAGFLDSAATLSGYDGKGIFLTDAAANPDVLSQANPARFPQIRGTRAKPLDEGKDLVYASFIAAYTAAFREDVRSFSFAANAYDAAWLLAYGAAWALLQEDGLDGTRIARGLRHVSDGESVAVRPGGWVSVQQAFRDGRSIDAAGASGPIDFDPDSEETAADIEVWRIDGGRIEGLYPVSP
ncbi:MAG TPA: ABC transporter substrate-binding protein [Kofleriaceae bacterium]|nr:ABC transporter substrate-binding protein [Kofleriaceae bacterium]